MEAKTDSPRPTCRVVMKKSAVQDLTVDKPVTLCLSGTIKSLMPLYSDDDMYEVEISNPKVEKTETEEKSEDDTNMATMPREKLKKKIQEPDAEEKE
jgi:hypothetical protein